MWNIRWLLALPLALAVSVGSAHASSIRDEAALFDPGVVREAEAKLNQLERDTGVTTTIETIDSLRGQSVETAAVDHARRTHTEGIFILIPKQEHRIKVLASRPYARTLTSDRLNEIERAFIDPFKKGNFDAGLRDGVQAIAHEVEAAQAANGGKLRQAEAPIAPIRGRPMVRPRANGNGFGIGSLLGIGLVILAVLVGIRLLGSLFGGGQRAYGPGMGRPGMGPGGYGGAPGYGGGGGGFMSSLFGGIGGAMAGNWLYDQFSGRHHGGSVDSSAYTPGGDVAPTGDAAGDDWSTGSSSATGDWGGGDAGGGGGDWGGGGGGGDWGGGGDGGGDGGSW